MRHRREAGVGEQRHVVGPQGHAAVEHLGGPARTSPAAPPQRLSLDDRPPPPSHIGPIPIPRPPAPPPPVPRPSPRSSKCATSVWLRLAVIASQSQAGLVRNRRASPNLSTQKNRKVSLCGGGEFITNLRVKMSRSVIAPRDAYAPVERVVAPVEAAELDPPRRGREAIILPILRPSESHAVGSPRRAVGGPNARVEARHTESASNTLSVCPTEKRRYGDCQRK